MKMTFGKCSLGYLLGHCPFKADDSGDLVDLKCDGCEHYVVLLEDDPEVIAAAEALTFIRGLDG